MTDLTSQIAALVSRIPEPQQQAAGALLAQYGPQFFEMAQEDAWAYLRRLMAGDLAAAAELDAKLADAQWLAQVAANTAAWANVAQYNKVRDDMKNELLLRLAPIVGGLLAGLVGL